MMRVEAAQAEYDAAQLAFTLAQGEVYAADREKQGVERDLRCAIVRSDDPSIAAIDKVFCSSRLAMAQARDDLAEAERQLAAALRPALPHPFATALATATAAGSPYVQRYEHDLQREQDAIEEDARVNARQAVRKTRSVIMHAFPPRQEVSA